MARLAVSVAGATKELRKHPFSVLSTEGSAELE